MAMNNTSLFAAELVAMVAANLDTMDMIQTSHVCRFWRQTINNSPSLWTCVNVVRDCRSSWLDDALTALLSRSGELALDLSIQNNCAEGTFIRPQKVEQSILDSLHRFTSLSLVAEFTGMNATNLVMPAPKLHTLTLSARRVRYYLQCLPAKLFAGAAPRLTRVRLRGFALPAEPFSFPSVQELVFTEAPTMYGHSLTAYNPADVSKMFPCLRRLVMGHEVPHFDLGLPTQQGLSEFFLYDFPSLGIHRLCLKMDISHIPHLRVCPRDELSSIFLETIAETWPPLRVARFYKSALEGQTVDGRVINLHFEAPTERIIGVMLDEGKGDPWLSWIEVAHFEADPFAELTAHWPRMEHLVSLEVDLSLVSSSNLFYLFGLDGGQHSDPLPAPQREMPSLREVKLKFLGGNKRIISWKALKYFITSYMQIGPPRLQRLVLDQIVPVDLERDGAFPGVADAITVDGKTVASREEFVRLEEATDENVRHLAFREPSISSQTDSSDGSDDENSDRSTSSNSTSKTRSLRASSSSSASSPSRPSASSLRCPPNKPTSFRLSSPDKSDDGADGDTVQWVLRASYPPRPFVDLILE